MPKKYKSCNKIYENTQKIMKENNILDKENNILINYESILDKLEDNISEKVYLRLVYLMINDNFNELEKEINKIQDQKLKTEINSSNNKKNNLFDIFIKILA